MVSEKYRLLRMLHEDSPVSFDYLESVDGPIGYTFTERQDQALLLPSWEAFISAATELWKALGPTDILFERVYEIA